MSLRTGKTNEKRDKDSEFYRLVEEEKQRKVKEKARNEVKCSSSMSERMNKLELAGRSKALQPIGKKFEVMGRTFHSVVQYHLITAILLQSEFDIHRLFLRYVG